MSQVSSLKAAMPGLRRILRRFWPQIRQQLPLIAGALLALLAEVGLRLLEPWPLKWLFDHFFTQIGAIAGTGQVNMPALQTLGYLALVAGSVVAIAGLRALTAYLSTVGLALAGNRILTEVRHTLYQHMLRLSLSFHTQARAGDLITRITGDVGRLQEVAVTAVLPLFIHSLTLIGMLSLMFWINWRLALIALVPFPLISLSMTRLTRRIRETAQTQRKREGALAATVAESLGAIQVVQAFTLENTLAKAFSQQNNKSFKEGVQGKRLSARLERTMDVLIALSTALTLSYGAWLVVRNTLTPGDLLVFLSYLKGAFRPVRDLAKYTSRIAKATAAGERVLDILDTPSEIQDAPHAVPAPPLQGHVRFENVWFGYSQRPPVLRNFTFDARPGQHIALVGPSGVGKSTLVNLLLRFYDPQQGCILIDGHDIRSFTLQSLRQQISVVLQESILFAASIRDNIAYGSPNATMAEIEAAARLANAHDFIMALPDGYDTILSERGTSLSGGQRQRIAIARAAIRKAPIVILDEPTTGLDKNNEHEVTEALIRLIEGRTAFLIAHNLRTTEHADVILYLENGQIVEQGTHHELMALGGRYARLYQLQESSRTEIAYEEARRARAS